MIEKEGLEAAFAILTDWKGAIESYNERRAQEGASIFHGYDSPLLLFHLLWDDRTTNDVVDWFRNEVVVPLWEDLAKKINSGGYLTQRAVYHQIVERVKQETEEGKKLGNSLDALHKIQEMISEQMETHGRNALLDIKSISGYDDNPPWSPWSKNMIQLAESHLAAYGLPDSKDDYPPDFMPQVRWSNRATWSNAYDRAGQRFEEAIAVHRDRRARLGMLVFRQNFVRFALEQYELFGKVNARWEDRFASEVAEEERDRFDTLYGFKGQKALLYFCIAFKLSREQKSFAGKDRLFTRKGMFAQVAKIASVVTNGKPVQVRTVWKSAEKNGWIQPGISIIEWIELINNRAKPIPKWVFDKMYPKVHRNTS